MSYRRQERGTVFAQALRLGLCLGLIACDASESPPIASPHLDAAEKMDSGLHLAWTNPTVVCDAIEVERRSASPEGKTVAEFSIIATLPGTADNKHDSSATEDLTYSYRLRCQKAGKYSPYSNELAVNPRR